MTAAHTTVLELLGKDVSFIRERKIKLTGSSFITLLKTLLVLLLMLF